MLFTNFSLVSTQSHFSFCCVFVPSSYWPRVAPTADTLDSDWTVLKNPSMNYLSNNTPSSWEYVLRVNQNLTQKHLTPMRAVKSMEKNDMHISKCAPGQNLNVKWWSWVTNHPCTISKSSWLWFLHKRFLSSALPFWKKKANFPFKYTPQPAPAHTEMGTVSRSNIARHLQTNLILFCVGKVLFLLLLHFI